MPFIKENYYLSILIRVFNGETVITHWLNRIKNQNLDEDEFEILILNDGSTDHTLLVIEKAKKYFKNISVFTAPNSRCDVSRNTLIDKTKGTYLYFLDSDDYLIPRSLNRILELAINNNCDVCGFGTQSNSNKDENTEMNKSYKSLRLDMAQIISDQDFIALNHLFRQEVRWYICKRNVIAENNLRFRSKKGYSSTNWVFTNHLIILAIRFSFIDIPIHRYYQSPGSIQRTTSAENQIKLIDSLMNAVLEFDNLQKDLTMRQHEINNYTMNYLAKRKGFMTVFSINKTFKTKLPNTFIREQLNILKIKELYPIKSSHDSNFESVKNFIFINLVNKEKQLFFKKILL